MFISRCVSALTLGILLTQCAAATNVAPGQSAERDGVEDQIKALERERQEAFVRGDIDFLDRQTAEDYTTINGTGVLSTKPQMMQSLRAGTTKVKSFELSDLEARLFGNVAVLTGIYRDFSSVRGQERQVRAPFTRIFVNDGGTWRAVAYQQTPLAE